MPARTRTPRDGRLDALIPWLALVALVARATGRMLVRAVRWGLPRVRVAGRHAARGLRGAAAASRRGVRAAAAAARPVLAREVWPRVALAATIVAGVTVLALARVGESAEHALTLAGIQMDRFLAALGDVVAVVATVWLPRAWRRLVAAWLPGAWRWTVVHLPRLARRTGQAVLATGALALLALPALHVASLVVDVSDLTPLADRSELRAADGTTLAVLHGGEERDVVPLDDVPLHVRQAVLAAEDRRFASHPGYDVVAVGRATVTNVRAGRVVEGASTVTQQLAKQNFTGGDRTVARKARELVYAIALERAYTKEVLLERYLNQVYFGAGAHGVAVAAWEYFRVPPEELTPDQGALLAALIRSPSFDPRADLDVTRARRDAVLAAMVETGALERAEFSALAARPVELEEPRPRGVAQPYLVAAIYRELLANPVFGDTRDEREQRLRTGGFTVHATLDPELQETVATVVADRWPDLDGPTAAVAAVEPGTGRVLALHGGRDFGASQFDLAAQARRQPGSLFKPFAAAAALEAGATPDTRLPAPARATFDLDGERWTVRNYGGQDLGTVDLTAAVAQSANTAFASLAVELGTERLVDVLARVGFDPERALGPPGSRGPSIALGGITNGVSPLEVAAAYAAFANEGRYVAPHLVERVDGPDGAVVHTAAPASRQALAADVAADVTAMLRAAVEDGTGTAARLPGTAVAGKTGTTQHGADAWFAGVTDRLAAAVWVGHPDGRTPMPEATGGRVAAPIWRDIADTRR